MAEAALERLRTLHGEALLDSGSHRGDEIAVVGKEQALDVLRTLRDDPELAFDMLSDLTVVDYLGQTPRFEVIYQLYSLRLKHRLRINASSAQMTPALIGICGHSVARRETVMIGHERARAVAPSANRRLPKFRASR